MAAYFICPKCKKNNYGMKNFGIAEPPKGTEYYAGLKCGRCGLTGICWVENEALAKRLTGTLKAPLSQFAIGVHDSPIEYMEPNVAMGRDEGILERLKGAATLEAPFSQGKRTQAFSPDTKAIQEGLCEGQCLHWIRRVLQAGTENYKAALHKTDLSDEEIIVKQRRQHVVAAAAQLVKESVQTPAFNTRRDAARSKATAERTAVENDESAALMALQAERAQVREKFETILSQMGFKKVGGGQWSFPRTMQHQWDEAQKKWDQIEERLDAKAKGITAKSKSRIDAADKLADERVKTLQSQNFYSYGWDGLAKQLDSWVEKKVKSGRKRGFSNIIVIKSKNRAKHATAGAFSIAMIKDQDFCEGTCALLSVGLSKGTGEAGGAIPGHAIAAHFKDVHEIYLFDPNVGIFKSGSLDEFRRSLETLIGTVWTQDLKWILDGTFGYSLFRMRPEGETNSVERGVPYSRSPEYTAAESKAEGVIPRALQK
jgi:hypothetical protein